MTHPFTVPRIAVYTGTSLAALCGHRYRLEMCAQCYGDPEYRHRARFFNPPDKISAWVLPDDIRELSPLEKLGEICTLDKGRR